MVVGRLEKTLSPLCYPTVFFPLAIFSPFLVYFFGPISAKNREKSQSSFHPKVSFLIYFFLPSKPFQNRNSGPPPPHPSQIVFICFCSSEIIGQFLLKIFFKLAEKVNYGFRRLKSRRLERQLQKRECLPIICFPTIFFTTILHGKAARWG